MQGHTRKRYGARTSYVAGATGSAWFGTGLPDTRTCAEDTMARAAKKHEADMMDETCEVKRPMSC